MVTAKRARTAETPKQPSRHLRSARLGSIPTEGGIRNPRCESKEHRSETLRLRLRASYFYPTVAADKATSQQVEVLPCQLPEVRHVAIPQLLRVISASLRGVNGPAAPWV